VSLNASNSSAIENHQSWHPVLGLSAQEVFETMLGSHLEAVSEPPPEEVLDVTAMVGLAGLLCGVLTIRCSSRAGARMASKMLGIDAEKAAAEIWDAMAKFAIWSREISRIKFPAWAMAACSRSPP